MKKYQSHKIVEADKIVTWNESLVGAGGSVITEGGTFEVPDGFFARGMPAPGDYLVRYGDGYLSWSPKQVFEDGYTAVGAGVSISELLAAKQAASGTPAKGST
jgi:hypothetical protein